MRSAGVVKLRPWNANMHRQVTLFPRFGVELAEQWKSQ